MSPKSRNKNITTRKSSEEQLRQDNETLDQRVLERTHELDQANQHISITRNLSIDLSPAVLKGKGLSDALVWLASQMRYQYGLQVTIATNGVPTRFEDTLRILLFQAVREALFNIVKHADTSHAEISISKPHDEVQIIVSDQGQGFHATAIFDESQATGGLMNIRHQLQLMGCGLEVKSQPGQGNHLVIHIPAKQFVT